MIDRTRTTVQVNTFLSDIVVCFFTCIIMKNKTITKKYRCLNLHTPTFHIIFYQTIIYCFVFLYHKCLILHNYCSVQSTKQMQKHVWFCKKRLIHFFLIKLKWLFFILFMHLQYRSARQALHVNERTIKYFFKLMHC